MLWPALCTVLAGSLHCSRSALHTALAGSPHLLKLHPPNRAAVSVLATHCRVVRAAVGAAGTIYSTFCPGREFPPPEIPDKAGQGTNDRLRAYSKTSHWRSVGLELEKTRLPSPTNCVRNRAPGVLNNGTPHALSHFREDCVQPEAALAAVLRWETGFPPLTTPCRRGGSGAGEPDNTEFILPEMLQPFVERNHAIVRYRCV